MGQQVLTVEINGETIVSKPFDFEAMCLVDDERTNSSGGVLRMGIPAVQYLFEGTKVTSEVLKGLSVQKQTALSQKVCVWYTEELREASKNE